MDRWKTIAITVIGAVSLNVSALAQPRGPSGSGTGQRTGVSQLSVHAAPSGLAVSARPSQGSEPLRTPDMTRSQPDPTAKPKAMGNDPVMSGSATKSEQVRATQAALKSKGYDPGTVDGIPGPKTTAGLTSFRRAENLPESGRGADRTLSRLGLQ